MTTEKFSALKCVNCNGYGTIGKNPVVICPACKGHGVMVIDNQTGAIVNKTEEVKEDN